MPEEQTHKIQPVKLVRETISKDKLEENVRPEISQLRSLMELAVARRSVDAQRPIRYRHQRAAQLFHMRPRRVEIPAPLLRNDAFFADPWWKPEEVDHSREEPDPNAPARADGSKLIRETRHEIQLLDGRKVTQIRQVLVSKTGRRFKEFQVVFPDEAQAPFGDIPYRLLPLYGIDRVALEQAQLLIVCEGVPATEALLKRGLAAVGTLTGALGTPARVALEPLLKSQAPVFLWPDNDDVGVQHMERVAQRLHDLGIREVRLIRWVGAPRKADAADFKGSTEDLQKLIEQARPWAPGKQSRHRGVLAVNPPTGALHLHLPLEERPSVPRLSNEPTPTTQRQLPTQVITQLEAMMDQEEFNESVTDEMRSRMRYLLAKLSASIGDLANRHQEEDDANSYR